jgi:phage terminase large subunit-like protein
MRIHTRSFLLPATTANPGPTWLILGGRGAGKTRAGAEWVRNVAANDRKARIALIAETEHDAREVMVEGVSGLLAVHRRDERPLWIPTRRRLQRRGGGNIFGGKSRGPARPAVFGRLVG